MSVPSKHTQLIEAALFVSTMPQSALSLSKKLKLSLAETEYALGALQDQLSTRGINIVESGTGYELAVAPQLRQSISSITNDVAPTLSQSSLEVLTIIAYQGPCPKLTIDEIRGTPSDNSLRALLSRDLIIQRKPQKNEKTIQYDLTSFAWRCLGISGRKHLPAKPKIKSDNRHAA